MSKRLKHEASEECGTVLALPKDERRLALVAKCEILDPKQLLLTIELEFGPMTLNSPIREATEPHQLVFGLLDF